MVFTLVATALLVSPHFAEAHSWIGALVASVMRTVPLISAITDGSIPFYLLAFNIGVLVDPVTDVESFDSFLQPGAHQPWTATSHS